MNPKWAILEALCLLAIVPAAAAGPINPDRLAPGDIVYYVPRFSEPGCVVRAEVVKKPERLEYSMRGDVVLTFPDGEGGTDWESVPDKRGRLFSTKEEALEAFFWKATRWESRPRQ